MSYLAPRNMHRHWLFTSCAVDVGVHFGELYSPVSICVLMMVRNVFYKDKDISKVKLRYLIGEGP
jgi:hypothetical protein